MSARIRLADALPEITPDLFTTGTAVVGIRGSGKTNNGVVLAEEAVRVGVPPTVIDPTGVWYGLKSGADGVTIGLPFYIFGGAHADVPLDPAAGALLARFAVEERVPIILDLSDISKGKQRRFVAEFAETLYDLKSRRREPLLLIVDEAQRFIPQQMQRGDPELAKCVGAIEDIVTLGRSRGLGAVLIGPRPATINKNVLCACDNLIAMRSIGTPDRKALDEWVTEAHGEVEARDAMMNALASLPNGEGFFWSPALFGIFRRVKFSPRRTFDSSRTPKVGESRIEPTIFAKVNLDALRGEMAALVERAKADDPGALRARIAELERQVAEVREYEVPPLAFSEMQSRAIAAEQARDKLIKVVRDLGSAARDSWRAVISAGEGMIREMDRITSFVQTSPTDEQPPNRFNVETAPKPVQRVNSAKQISVSVDTGLLSKAQRAILTVLAQRPSGCDREALGLLAGYSPGSGHFGNVLGSLRTAGYVNRSEPVQITPEGRTALGPFDPLPTGAALHAYWIDKLDKAPGAMLRVLIDAHPRAVTKETLGKRAGYSHTSGHFGNSLGRLRTLGLAVGRDEIRASEALF